MGLSVVNMFCRKNPNSSLEDIDLSGCLYFSIFILLYNKYCGNCYTKNDKKIPQTCVNMF